MVPKVALLDAGAQLEKVISRRVLELGYAIEKFPVDESPEKFKDADALIISGGPRSVNDPDAKLPSPEIWSMGKPVFGICYGLQAATVQLGGTVVRGEHGQYGRKQITLTRDSELFSGLPKEQRVLMSHFDTIEKVAAGFDVLAMSDGLVAAIGDSQRKFYATQFHPELVPVTKYGKEMFSNFFHGICGFPVQKARSLEDETNSAERIIHETIGSDGHIMWYLSGGVDSTVASVLSLPCVEPERLHFRLLDTGFMRKGEIEEVCDLVAPLRLPDFKVLDVAERMYSAMHDIDKSGRQSGPLSSVTHSEVKRKLFGFEYATIADEEIQRIADALGVDAKKFYLGQGTLRPDIIESGDTRATKGKGDVIKTHHNAVEKLKDMQKVEPLVELFKDQVREMAVALGLPESLAYRQPFPGPGMIPRILCYDGGELPDLSALDERVQKQAGVYGFSSRTLPIKSVGVQGDERSYKHAVVLSGVEDWGAYERAHLELPDSIREINRVVYLVGREGFPQDGCHLTPTLLTPDVVEVAQEADYWMRKVANAYGLNDARHCAQMPGILLPVSFQEGKRYSYVIRLVHTFDFMALIGMIPYECAPADEFISPDFVHEAAEAIINHVPDIGDVMLDSTDKPPGSTEWE